MRKVFFGFIFLWILWVILFWIQKYNQAKSNDVSNNNKVIRDLSAANKILSSQKVLPTPWWNLIYYNLSWNIVSWSNYDIISWRLCWKSFTEIWIDYKDPFTEKCYKYSITKDYRNFQIWWLIKNFDTFKTYLTWNIDKSLTKNCFEDNLVQNWDEKNFPFNPYTRYVTAKIVELNLSKWWIMRIIDNQWKKHDFSQKPDYIIRPNDTIILKWKDSLAHIKFENQDILRMEWGTIIKVKQMEMQWQTSDVSLFWLVGKIVYNIYDSTHEKVIQTPVNTISIKWDILRWDSTISNSDYSLSTMQSSNSWSYIKNNNKYIIKSNWNIDSLFTDNELWADVLGYKFDIEKLISLDKN